MGVWGLQAFSPAVFSDNRRTYLQEMSRFHEFFIDLLLGFHRWSLLGLHLT
jgi:hypothetical protein